MPLSHHTFFFFFFIYFSLSNFLLFSFTHHDHKFEGNNVRITNRNFTHSITNFTRSHHITLLHNFFLHQTAQFKNQENKSCFLNLLYKKSCTMPTTFPPSPTASLRHGDHNPSAPPTPPPSWRHRASSPAAASSGSAASMPPAPAERPLASHGKPQKSRSPRHREATG